MSLLLRYFYFTINYLNFKLSKVKIERFSIYGKIYIINKGAIIIGNNFSANSGRNKNPIGGDTILRLITHNKSARIIIGKNVGISNSTIYCWREVIIGDNVVIGGSTKIWDSNFHSLDPKKRVSGNDDDIRNLPIKIGDNVFIGGGTTILKGVTIGENSVIAAGSVVSKSIPPNCIVGGNPCTIIKQLNLNEQQI